MCSQETQGAAIRNLLTVRAEGSSSCIWAEGTTEPVQQDATPRERERKTVRELENVSAAKQATKTKDEKCSNNNRAENSFFIRVFRCEVTGQQFFALL